MSQPQDETSVTASEPVHRSRWRRFSPSMGWRAFWSEILIVVLGVVIALAANEVVQDWTWRNKVEDAEARLQVDSNAVFKWSAEQFSVQPCIIEQLDGLARRVMDAGATLAPAPVFSEQTTTPFPLTYVVRIPTRPWRFAVWEALLADGTAPHFDSTKQLYYNGIQSQAAAQREFRLESDRLRGRVSALAYPVALDPVVRREFLVDLESLRHQTRSAAIVAMQLMRTIDTNGSAPTPEDFEAYVSESGTVQFCKAQGLPLADWRGFREANVDSAKPNQAKAP